ncbi:hypothetical protein B0T13DRAFT_379369, partial [Neurospora crassa]
VMGLAPVKASGSDWPDLSAKTAACVETSLADTDCGATASGAWSFRAFSSCLEL